jgi:hypothetical protein
MIEKCVLRLGYYCLGFALNELNIYFVSYTATNGPFESKKLHALNSLITISFSRKILKREVSALVSGAFAKLRKATISFVMSVRTCIRPHRTSQFPRNRFSLNLVLKLFFLNLSRKFKIY